MLSISSGKNKIWKETPCVNLGMMSRKTNGSYFLHIIMGVFLFLCAHAQHNSAAAQQTIQRN